MSEAADASGPADDSAGGDWRPVVAALANADARSVWAQLVVGGTPAGAGLAPARKARALALLESAGLVRSVDGSDQPEEAVFRRLLAAASAEQPRRQGVQRFLRVDGRIDRYPAGADDRRELLAHVAASILEPGETVAERDLTERLARFGDDPVALRRYLVDAGLVLRTRSGSEYGLADAD
ncbi:DUF2087 domain-containing protein [Leifsonia sp. 2MCAF36]|uniref:DUF2087 domain-containing protein n=1 Tax=Leifsonia sp. 2MCAF36 TaxID=3232988 RepID=UPI003F992907